MESNLKELERELLIQKNVTIDSHIILDKSHFTCVICYDFSPNLYETGCCNNFVCSNCKNLLTNKQCPMCRIETTFTYSKMVKKIIQNSIAKCPLCDYCEIQDLIPSHLKKEHFDEIKNIDFIRNNKKLYNYINSLYDLEYEKKVYIHDHKLVLTIKNCQENFLCFFGLKTKDSECEMKYNKTLEIKKEGGEIKKHIDPKTNEEIHDMDDIEIINANIQSFTFEKKNSFNKNFNPEEFEENKKLFLRNFCYKCEICNVYFCNYCIKSKKVVLFSKIHPHPLSLKHEDSGWGCDGSYTPEGCKSELNNYFSSNGYLRYHCKPCDFDLCEKCMYLHFDDSDL